MKNGSVEAKELSKEQIIWTKDLSLLMADSQSVYIHVSWCLIVLYFRQRSDTISQLSQYMQQKQRLRLRPDVKSCKNIVIKVKHLKTVVIKCLSVLSPF